jgi:hypothetical protein
MVGVVATGQDGLEREHNQPSEMKNKAQNSNSRQVRERGLKTRNEVTQEVGDTFVANLRAEAPQAAEGIMLVEVISLCGERYRPLAEPGYRRAGR